MATITYDGATLATDSDYSDAYYLLDRVGDSERLASTIYQQSISPRGNGIVFLEMGTDPATIFLRFRLALSGSNRSAWGSLVDGKRGKLATLAWPDGGSGQSRNRIILLDATPNRVATLQWPTGGSREVYDITMAFKGARS